MINKTEQDLNLKILLATRSHLLYAIAVALGIALVIFVGIMPQIQSSLELASESQKEQPKLDKLKKKLVELENIQFTPEFAQEAIVNDALPSKKPLLELLTSLQSIASANQVFITNFELSPGDIATQSGGYNAPKTTKGGRSAARKESNGAVDTLDVEMEISGSAAQVREFLVQLEKITPFTTITKLSVEKVIKDAKEDDTLDATLTTETYFFTQSISATLDAPLPTLSSQEKQVLETLASFVANDLPEQTEITGGGLEDLFGVNPLEFQ